MICSAQFTTTYTSSLFRSMVYPVWGFLLDLNCLWYTGDPYIWGLRTQRELYDFM